MLQRERAVPDDQEVPYLKALHVQADRIVVSGDLPSMWANRADEDSVGVRPGDLLVCEGGQIGRSAVVPPSIPPLTVIEKSLHRIRSRGGSIRYLYYVLESLRASGWFDIRGGSATLKHLTGEALSETRVPFPHVATQRAIADYLDRETARIATLIAAKERMVELLEERWQSIMHAAVAGRLLPSGSRRVTTIPWLRDVPAHWKEGLLKLVARLGSGHTPSRSHPEWWLDPTIPWITTGEVGLLRNDRVEYIHETRECICEVGMMNSSAGPHRLVTRESSPPTWQPARTSRRGPAGRRSAHGSFSSV
jgi:type I restriction enzyme S subunit